MISGDELFFFNEKTAALPLYETFARRLLAEIDNVTVKVKKTQISFQISTILRLSPFCRSAGRESGRRPGSP